MALRVLVYTGLHLQGVQGQKQFLAQGLPDTLAAVIYNGLEAWTAPTTVKGLLRNAIPVLKGDQLVHQYRLIDEARRVRAGQLPKDNLASSLFMLEHDTPDNRVQALKWLNDRL